MNLQQHEQTSQDDYPLSVIDTSLRSLLREGRATAQRMLADAAALLAKNAPEARLLQEKARLLEQWTNRLAKALRGEPLARQEAPFAELERDPDDPMVLSTPDVCGGSPRLANTRIPVWLLVDSRHRRGRSDASLLKSYPTLQQHHLDAAWAYYEQHRAEIDAEILRQNEE